MSLTVVGYKNGRRIVRDDGPARARPAGYGGQAIGSSDAPTVLTHAQRKARQPVVAKVPMEVTA